MNGFYDSDVLCELNSEEMDSLLEKLESEVQEECALEEQSRLDDEQTQELEREVLSERLFSHNLFIHLFSFAFLLLLNSTIKKKRDSGVALLASNSCWDC